MGLADWFCTFCGNLEVRNGAMISRHYRNITRGLNTDFWGTPSETSHSRQVGSYGRNTAIHGASDVDMVFQVPWSLHEHYDSYRSNGQSALLQEVRDSVVKTYPGTEIGADGHVIRIPFSDRIAFGLVPGFRNIDSSYIYPDSNAGGSWRRTNPKPELEAIQTRNSECNDNLIQLCRMMRAWKKKWRVPIGGMLIDTLAYQFIINWKDRNRSYFYYDFLCRDFFSYMADQRADQEYWRAPGSSQRVHGGQCQFQYKAKRCHDIALQAIEYETATPKRERAAKQDWRKIFGTAFPG